MEGLFCTVEVDLSLVQTETLCPDEYQGVMDAANRLRAIEMDNGGDLYEAEAALRGAMTVLRGALIAKLNLIVDAEKSSSPR